MPKHPHFDIINMLKNWGNKMQKKSKKKLIIIIILLVVLINSAIAGVVLYQNHLKEEAKKAEEVERIKNEKKLVSEIKEAYNEVVYGINEETTLYTKNKDKYEPTGKVGKDIKITLEEIKDITIDNEYFKVTNIDGEYYVHYKDIETKEEIKTSTKQTGMGSLSLRYKNYIPFNENVVTKDEYSLYSTEDKFLYTLKGSISKPILIKKSDKYYFEFQNSLVYVKKDDVEKLEKANNTTVTPSSQMAVLLYHFFYDKNNAAERNECNQSICMSTELFRQHLDYMKNNGFFTPNMDEFEMYIGGELRLPKKSVLITIDDGWYSGGGTQALTEYKMNGTMFLISSAYDPKWTVTDYIEVHSHTDNMHINYQCTPNTSYSQGGALLCWDEQKILNDLKLSREKLYNTHVFAYPFYDYNDRALKLLKQSGFTMAFIGGYRKADVGVDKMLVPRYTIMGYDSVNTLASLIN